MVELGNLPRHFWLIQITGEAQSPRLAGDYSSTTAALEQKSPGSCVEPQQGYCRRILQQNESLEKGLLNAYWMPSHAGKLLLQVALAGAHQFSWNKDIPGWRQKVLPYLLVDTEGTKQSRSCMTALDSMSSTLLYSSSLSIMHKGLWCSIRWGNTAKKYQPNNFHSQKRLEVSSHV